LETINIICSVLNFDLSIFNTSYGAFSIDVRLIYLKGLEVAELTEEDIPMV